MGPSGLGWRLTIYCSAGLRPTHQTGPRRRPIGAASEAPQATLPALIQHGTGGPSEVATNYSMGAFNGYTPLGQNFSPITKCLRLKNNRTKNLITPHGA